MKNGMRLVLNGDQVVQVCDAGVEGSSQILTNIGLVYVIKATPMLPEPEYIADSSQNWEAMNKRKRSKKSRRS